MTMAADLFPLFARCLSRLMRVCLYEKEDCSRENGSKLVKAGETKFRSPELQGLGKERDFVDILNLKVRKA